MGFVWSLHLRFDERPGPGKGASGRSYARYANGQQNFKVDESSNPPAHALAAGCGEPDRRIPLGATVLILVGMESLAILGADDHPESPCNLAAGIIMSLAVPYRINPGRITRPAGAQANTLPAALIQLGVLGIGTLVFWLCWPFKIRWLPVPIFLVLAAGASFFWMRILHYSNDNASQRRESLIAVLMETE
jgi:hypothetical protein